MVKKGPDARPKGPQADAPEPGKARLELEFDRPALLGSLFGQFDQNLITIENRLGVYIAARGNRVAVEGEPLGIARARDVLNELYARLERGMAVENADVETAIAIAGETTSEGVKVESGGAPAMIRTRRKTIVARTATQARYIEALGRNDMIFALGPAGTGKTYLAVAQAVSQLITGSVDRLILSRPAVEAGERLGFLPGDMNEKVDPYMAPVFEALGDILGAEQLRRRREKGEIEVAPIAFLRGRTLSHAFIIIDEAQNTTRLQMKMVLTRIGEGSRMAVTGDPSQIDLVNAADSGLAHAVGLLEGVEGVGVNRFTAQDIVRHPMVERIVRAYDADAAKSGRAI